jgi:hypothetical protein
MRSNLSADMSRQGAAAGRRGPDVLLDGTETFGRLAAQELEC